MTSSEELGLKTPATESSIDFRLCLLCQGDKFTNIKGGSAATTSIGIIPSNVNHWWTVYSAYCVKETNSLTSEVVQLQQPALESYHAMATIGGLYKTYGSIPKP